MLCNIYLQFVATKSASSTPVTTYSILLRRVGSIVFPIQPNPYPTQSTTTSMPVAVAKEEPLDPDMVKVSPPSTTPELNEKAEMTNDKDNVGAAVDEKPEKDEMEEKIQETLRQIRARTDK